VCGSRGGGGRWLARGRAQWWRQRSNCCAAAEEKQLHGKAMEDGGRRRRGGVGRGVHFFLFLAGWNPTFNPTLYQETPKNDPQSYPQSYQSQSYLNRSKNEPQNSQKLPPIFGRIIVWAGHVKKYHSGWDLSLYR
jgi:hypothetical protein